MTKNIKLVKQFFALLRISHWSKSIFVLLGIFYAGAFNHIGIALLAALAFCLVASAVYIYNDLQDREEDKLHPHKQFRPLAQGDISLDLAVGTLLFLLIFGIGLAWFISSTLVLILGVYLLINLMYNHLFKSIPILDVLCIASGFMLRVLAGTIGIGLPISRWLTLTATLISLLIAFCKRRLEKQLNLKLETRIVLKRYSIYTLDLSIIITAFSAFTAYFFYTIFARSQSFYFLLTLPFAAIGLWRFARLSMCNHTNDDPVALLFSDNLSRVNMVCFFAITLIALTQ